MDWGLLRHFYLLIRKSFIVGINKKNASENIVFWRIYGYLKVHLKQESLSVDLDGEMALKRKDL